MKPNPEVQWGWVSLKVPIVETQCPLAPKQKMPLIAYKISTWLIQIK